MNRFKKEFEVSKDKFVLTFDKFVINKIDKIFNIDFVKIINGENERGITNAGNPFRILSKMRKIIESYLITNEDINPNGFFFIAEEPSRQKLYKRYSQIIMKKYGNRYTKVEDYSKFKIFEDYNTDNLFLFIRDDIYKRKYGSNESQCKKHFNGEKEEIWKNS